MSKVSCQKHPGEGPSILGVVRNIFSSSRWGLDSFQKFSRRGQIFFFKFTGGHQEIDEKCPKNGLKWPENIISKGHRPNFF